jgi:uncharacterized membrane protein
VIGLVHLLAAVLALASGLLVLLTRKGKRRHRRLGWTYVGAMAAVNLTALMIYDLFGGFGPFHIAALVSGVTIIAGVIPAVRRRPARGWVEYHAHWMVWSYIGLVAAAVSEISTRFLDLPFGATARRGCLTSTRAPFPVCYSGGLPGRFPRLAPTVHPAFRARLPAGEPCRNGTG